MKPCLTDLQVRGKPKADEHDVELDSDEETQGKANAFCPSVDTYRHVLDSLAKALKRYACRLIVGVGTTDTYVHTAITNCCGPKRWKGGLSYCSTTPPATTRYRTGADV